MQSFTSSLNLNEQQLEAVTTTDGPLLVLAGAGTGKTRVITSRIAYLIHNNYALPSEILAVTFTNKAASEMGVRISELTSNINGLTNGTFHSVASKILRQNASYVGLTSSFVVVDAEDQQKLVKQIINENNLTDKPPKLFLNIISRWKDMGLSADQLKDNDIRSDEHSIAKIIYKHYQKRLLSSNACDFGDLLLYNTKIFFEQQAVLEYLQDKFKHILIDEYQDTNPVQYLWARMLAAKHKNICCVGDDDQSIYSWRGAEVGNILRFEQDFKGAKVIKLEQNYRSTTPILLAASSLIKNNKLRHSKTLWTGNEGGEPLLVVSCFNDKDEAKYISSHIQNLTNANKVSNNQIAILVRAGFQTRPFEESFVAYSIPYRIIGGLKFYERAEIKDSLAYIRLIINNNDDLAFDRIINLPKRSIGPTTLAPIRNRANDKSISYFSSAKELLRENAFKPKVKSVISLFIDQIEYWGRKASSADGTNAETVKSMLNESGYIGMWKAENTDESKARIDNINEMIRSLNEFDSLNEFIEHTSLIMDNDNANNNGEGVNVMTLHSSKGLEFDIVFIPGMEEGIFPHQKSINENGEKGIEEERRLAYVGMTRAKKKLILTYAENRRIFNEFVNSKPSRFIDELPLEIYQKTNRSFYNEYTPSREFIARDKSYNNNATNKKLIFEDENGIRPGNKIIHKSFGKGIVIKKNGDNLEIYFENKMLKTIKQDFVELCK